MDEKPVIIIGAGPAGLAAANELSLQGVKPIVLEKSNIIGGLARTETYKGYNFDIGGHRFFTKSDAINQLWKETLGEKFMTVRRLSRIYYRGRYFKYPLSSFNAIYNLGIAESILILFSYLKSKLRPHKVEENLEQWISNRFGWRLYKTFFQTYTEKVWGKPCQAIQADWAAQRIKGLSLVSAVVNALIKNQKAKTLIDKFSYPSYGPGMMWEHLQGAVEARGGEVQLGTEVISIKQGNGGMFIVSCTNGRQIKEIQTGHVISSMPITLLVDRLVPKPPTDVIVAAKSLCYRAFCLVVLIVGKEDLFPDQWIYIHSPDVKVGRIQNFKNWSSAMVPDVEKTSVGLEYFCDEDDDIWSKPDTEFVQMASEELSRLGIADVGDVIDGFVIRQSHAYPVYDNSYKRNLKLIREYLASIDNLQTIGRNGMHRYNNMDHSMLTGIMAAQNTMGARRDVWQVNEDGKYLEENELALEKRRLVQDVIIQSSARIDKLAFGSAAGFVSGLLFFVLTLWSVAKGGDVVGPNMALLKNYYWGYTVSVKGALIAFGFSFFWGFLYGWLLAYLRNFFVAYYLYRVKRKQNRLTIRKFFDSF